MRARCLCAAAERRELTLPCDDEAAEEYDVAEQEPKGLGHSKFVKEGLEAGPECCFVPTAGVVMVMVMVLNSAYTGPLPRYL